MDPSTLIAQLDAFFEIGKYDERGFWDTQPESYRLMASRFVAPGFWEGVGNGLMLDNTAQIERVYLAVFPAQAVIDMAIAREIERGAPGALLFTHHVFAYDPLKGYVNIPEVQLADLRDQNISLYVSHAPLQCHAAISTAGALANALRLREQERFVCHADSHQGVWGHVKPMTFQAFAQRLAKVCELSALRYDQVCHNGLMVERVAIVPGMYERGDIVELVGEALELGCDTFVSGQWWPYAETEWAEAQRARLREYMTGLQMNLLGAGHYQSELVVLRDQMQDWFKQLGIDTQLLREPAPAPAE